MKKEEQVVDLVFKQKLEQQNRIKQRKKKRRNRRLFTFLTIVSLISFYLISDLSKPKAIIVSGNNILSKEEVIKAANINSDTKLLLANPFLMKKSLRKHPFISNTTVDTSLISRKINIEVNELEIFGYRQTTDETSMILSDGEAMTLTPDYYSFLANLIYVDGFTDLEDQQRLVKSFSEVDVAVLSQVSEIHQTSVSYDDKLLEILMNDGNKVYTSFQTVERLNYYFDIILSLSANNSCIYFDELSQEAYSQKCPLSEE